jgi:hypothetical protein
MDALLHEHDELRRPHDARRDVVARVLVIAVPFPNKTYRRT